MRQKIYNALHKIYGSVMTVSFFAGILPLIPFIIAIIIGGETGEAISVFLNKQYYPWVIALASIAVIIGLIAMYVGKLQGLSIKKINAEVEQKTDGNITVEVNNPETIPNSNNEENKDSEEI